MRTILHPLAAALMCLLGFALPAKAATFPEKTIRFIVPNTAGSATDQLARAIASTVQQRSGVPVLVDNKPGANGILAAESVARSAPDGYTVLIGNSTTNAANPSLYKKLSYDADKDFAPISGLGRGSQVLVVNNDLPVKTIADLIGLVKANPDKYAYGSGGASARVASETFAQMAGVKLLHVPYKGNPPAMADLIAGQIQIFFPDMTTALPMIRGGKVRALAVTSKTRSSYLPELPTLQEAGLSGYQAGYWFAAYAPAGTPPEIVSALNKLISEGVRSEGATTFFRNNGMEAFATTPEQLRSFTREEIANWATSAKAAGIQPE
ncbi:Bug family tripartite tricarboxylate transporter substrate binding protein [Hydrogenophaga sp. BPS33]|uniref:Bug family tripartite tricarboxylate transporter substrate binding protein n=1 Tax=Hydrogenophaga sp. BPS33 TaxID=2651974 RepID=UPI0013200151|nr:tripartite tricarboxylate transporter substrate binding protein [Hydrogenophaga sp. BPS33]QHE83400.1 tripartite tricarboxylate transporter substrate binding protein [Hydrogenophaga sp. BPS33]